MKTGPLRTIALCALCAALAGAGSAALAADDDDPGTSAAPTGPAQKLTMRKCVLERADATGEDKGGGVPTCTVTTGDGPPPGGKPRFGGCTVKLDRAPADAGAAAKQKLAVVARATCRDGGPPDGAGPAFGGCTKAAPGTAGEPADDAALDAKKRAIAKERAAAAT